MNFFKKTPSEFFQKMFEKLTKKSIEQDVIGIRDQVQQMLKNSEKAKIKDVMAAIKKIIKEDIEAVYKFFALLMLREVMESRKPFVVDYFVKKLSDRLIKIAKHREKKKESVKKKGETCLSE